MAAQVIREQVIPAATAPAVGPRTAVEPEAEARAAEIPEEVRTAETEAPAEVQIPAAAAGLTVEVRTPDLVCDKQYYI